MDTTDIETFLALVEAGSVLRAAEALGVSRATVRRRLEALEAEVGRPVLERQGERLELTPEGKLLLREGPSVVGATRRLQSALRQVGAATIEGTLTVAFPSGWPGAVFTQFARKLADQWPRLRVEGRFTDDPAGELSQGADLALVVGERPGEPWGSRRLVDYEERAVVHPRYVQREGLPRSVEELQRHRLMAAGSEAWPLRRGGRLRVEPTVMVNDLSVLADAVDEGLGIALLPLTTVPERWQPVLPTLVGGRRVLWLANAPDSRWSPSVRGFGDALAGILEVVPLVGEAP
ncbi:MAG: LysR family transcriptional regulator [Myxococcota bacterium]